MQAPNPDQASQTGAIRPADALLRVLTIVTTTLILPAAGWVWRIDQRTTIQEMHQQWTQKKLEDIPPPWFEAKVNRLEQQMQQLIDEQRKRENDDC